MSQKSIDQLVERRANAMAIVLLTSRDDLRVTPGEKEFGIDLVVSVAKKDQPAFRQFGLIVLGHPSELESASEACPIMTSLLARRPEIEGILTPICVFLFSMTGNRGFYAWKFEPTTTKKVPRLHHHESLDCHDLNGSALAKIVKSVERYYDTLAVTLIGP